MGGNGNGNQGKFIALTSGSSAASDEDVAVEPLFSAGDAAIVKRYSKRIVQAARAEILAMVDEFCAARNVITMTPDGRSLMTTTGRQCGGVGPGTPAMYSGLDLPGCPVNVDACAFPALDTDLRLFSWPEIEAQMWDTDTALNVVLAGAFPVAPGGTVLLEQELRRTITWIPAAVMITTTWGGGPPQPSLLSYQWSSGPKGAIAGRVDFSNPQKGNQYEGGASPNTSTTPIKQRFPTYRGVDSIPIGALSSLSLRVTLDTIATSNLQAIDVRVYHKKSKAACCDNCRAGVGACSCNV